MKKDDFEPSKQKSVERGHFTKSVCKLELYLREESLVRLFISIILLTHVHEHISFDSETAKSH